MIFRGASLAFACAVAFSARTAELPPNLVADGIPPIPVEVKESASRYLDFRTAAFQSWHPKSESMLITTRFGDAPQIHEVSTPGGARRQLTVW